MKQEPVLIAQIVAAIMSLLSALVALDVINLLPEQMAAVEQALGAILALLIPLLAAIWARSQVTPLRAPRDNAGAPLVRADGRDPVV